MHASTVSLSYDCLMNENEVSQNQENDVFAELVESFPHFHTSTALAAGTFGTVIQAVDTRTSPPTSIAIKLVPRGGFVRTYRTYLKREIVHAASLRHPAVVPLREAFLTPNYLGISMDFAAGGDLQGFLATRRGCRLPEQEARWLFQQLAIGISYCHRRGVANRDIKLENLLLDDVSISKPLLRICDWGCSKHEHNSSAKTGVGTTPYMAPEVFLGAYKYDAKAADMWSSGVVLYALLVGRLPFDPEDPSFAQSVVTASYALPPAISISESCTNLLSRLLDPDPSRRASAEEVLKHPWFLSDLPPGALQLNNTLLRWQKGCADRDAAVAAAVDALVDKAQTPGPPGDTPSVVQL